MSICSLTIVLLIRFQHQECCSRRVQAECLGHWYGILNCCYDSYFKCRFACNTTSQKAVPSTPLTYNPFQAANAPSAPTGATTSIRCNSTPYICPSPLPAHFRVFCVSAPHTCPDPTRSSPIAQTDCLVYVIDSADRARSASRPTALPGAPPP
jgi:hypothetical protein